MSREGGTPAPQAPGARSASRLRARTRWLHLLNASFGGLTGAVAIIFLLLVAGLVGILLVGALPALGVVGASFLTGSGAVVGQAGYGAFPAIAGTLLTSLFALLLAVPVALGVAIFLSESAPRALRAPLTSALDVAAAVPSVVYGLWAYLVIVPWLRSSAEPSLAGLTSGGFPFSGRPLGEDLLSAGIVLAVMIIPTIAAISRESLQAVPSIHREAALSLGATRWEATRMTVLGSARAGIIGAIMLGLGRAVGETIAMAILFGTTYQVPFSLFAPGVTLASWIANNFTAPGTTVDHSSLLALGLVLLLISALVNVGGRLLLHGLSSDSRLRRRWSWLVERLRRDVHREHRPAPHRADISRVSVPPAWLVRAIVAAPARRAVRRRKQFLMLGLIVGCTILALVPLASILATAAVRGAPDVVRPAFYTSNFPIAPPPGQSGALGGIAPAIEGSLVMLGIALAVAVPLGLLAGLFVSELGRGGVFQVPSSSHGTSRRLRVDPVIRALGRATSFVAEVMTGMPTILLGLFAFELFFQFEPGDAEGALVGGFALGVVMIPIVLRATEAALRSVPASVREAALALGFPRHRVALRVVLGCSRSGLVTGVLLALSRAAGDAACLIVTAGYATVAMASLTTPAATLPTFIFFNFNSPSTNLQEAAWGAALVLILLMLVIQVFVRLAVARGAVALPTD